MDNEKCKIIEKFLSEFSEILPSVPLDVRIFMACQLALESGYGSSSLSLKYFNYSGMKNPLVRFSSALHAGDRNYFWSQYSSLRFCVFDYILCLQYHRPRACDYKTVEHFASFISKFYCPELDYIDKINSIYKSYKLYKNGN